MKTYLSKRKERLLNFLYYLSVLCNLLKELFLDCSRFLFESGCKVTANFNTHQTFSKKNSFLASLFLVYLQYRLIKHKKRMFFISTTLFLHSPK